MLSQALRSLQRTPVYAGTVVLTLALGVAAVGTMWAIVHGVLFAPLPFAESERLVSVRLELPEGGGVGVSPAVLATYRSHATQLDELALYRTGSANVRSTDEESAAEHLVASWLSASALRVLGVAPSLGRSFSEDEERRGGPDAVILSATEWKTRFAASPDALDQTLIVNDVPRRIVGVMPEGFAFPAPSTRLWLPVKTPDSAIAGDFLYTLVARLRTDASVESARRELAAVLPRMAERFPRLQSGGSTAAWLDEARPAPQVQRLREAMTGGLAPTLWLLAALAALVLAVAWANVASLLLIRTDERRQEVAIREALGAGSFRASTQTLGEAVVLGLLAGLLALLVVAATLFALHAWGPVDLPRRTELALGPWSAACILLGAVLGTLLGTVLLTRLGRLPALAGRLQGGGRSQTSATPRQRLRTAASVLQIAAALVVLASAGLLLSTALRLHDVHPGFEADEVSTFRILLPFARYGDSARVAFHARLIERVGKLPMVQAAGLAAQLPLGPGQVSTQNFLVEGQTPLRAVAVNVISDGYFAAMRIPLHAGRDFRPLELQPANELIISQRAASVLFAESSGVGAVGKRLTLEPGGPSYTVVGVVGDVRNEDLARPPDGLVYRPQVVADLPQEQPGPLPAMSLAVRSKVPPEQLAAAVRRIVHELDPGVPVFEVSSMRDVLRASLAQLTLLLWLMSAAAVVTVLLGAIGLYGLLAYLVALRTRELGVRMALGADRGRIARWVLARGLRLTAFGVSLGACVFAGLTPYLRASMVGIPASDPLSFAGAIALLLGTATLASSVPAWRATAVDPAQAIRAG